MDAITPTTVYNNLNEICNQKNSQFKNTDELLKFMKKFNLCLSGSVALKAITGDTNWVTNDFDFYLIDKPNSKWGIDEITEFCTTIQTYCNETTPYNTSFEFNLDEYDFIGATQKELICKHSNSFVFKFKDKNNDIKFDVIFPVKETNYKMIIDKYDFTCCSNIIYASHNFFKIDLYVKDISAVLNKKLILDEYWEFLIEPVVSEYQYSDKLLKLFNRSEKYLERGFTLDKKINMYLIDVARHKK